MMKSFMSHENYTTASANYAEAYSACSTVSCASDNSTMLIVGAIIMASIIIFRISISLLVLGLAVLLGILVIKENVNKPKSWDE